MQSNENNYSGSSCVSYCSGNKVGYEHHFDARPIAHVPNSGEPFSSTTSLKNAAEPVGTSWTRINGLWRKS